MSTVFDAQGEIAAHKALITRCRAAMTQTRTEVDIASSMIAGLTMVSIRAGETLISPRVRELSAQVDELERQRTSLAAELEDLKTRFVPILDKWRPWAEDMVQESTHHLGAGGLCRSRHWHLYYGHDESEAGLYAVKTAISRDITRCSALIATIDAEKRCR